MTNHHNSLLSLQAAMILPPFISRICPFHVLGVPFISISHLNPTTYLPLQEGLRTRRVGGSLSLSEDEIDSDADMYDPLNKRGGGR